MCYSKVEKINIYHIISPNYENSIKYAERLNIKFDRSYRIN